MSKSRPNDDQPRKTTRRRTKPKREIDPAGSPETLGETAVLIHELANLVDGSLRCLSLARRAICGSDAWAADPQSDRVQKQLDAASVALEQMSGLVHGALQGPGLSLGSPVLSGTRPVTLSDAIEHAAEVMRPAATELGASIFTTVTEPAGSSAAGPLYLAILNAIKNSVEAIARTATPDQLEAGGVGGSIHIQARTEEFDVRTCTRRRMLAIEVTDDGQGPPIGSDLARVFDQGFTRKPGGLGIGLAVAKAIVEQAGGTIALLRRREVRDPRRPGALLRIVVPAPSGTRMER